MSIAMYQSNLDRVEQEEIVKTMLPKIKSWVIRVSSRLPANVDNDDLYSAACMGLVESLQKFDKGRSVDFYSYAERRIKGAILDALRQMDFLPRNVRTRLKHFEDLLHELTGKLGRRPNIDELVEYTKLTMDEVYNFLNLIETGQITSLDSTLDEDGDISLMDTIRSYVESPEDSVSKEQIVEKLGEVIDTLPEKEKLVITLYYYEELTMKEIGDILNISESRVSQIHSEAIKKMKKKLKGAL
jgi:RNA polymerase sigma factor for flagellar operon FliA